MGRKILLTASLLAVFLWLSPCTAWAQETEGIFEKSGAGELYGVLDEETQDLLSQAGVESGQVGESTGAGLFQTFSQLFREKLTSPLQGLAVLLGVVILCRLAALFGGEGGAPLVAGALACATVLTAPLLELVESTARVIENACVFLSASVPVYGALMIASGSTAAGGSYSFLTLAAGNVVSLLASSLLIPFLRAFLMLSLASPLSTVKLDRLVSGLYGFAKWMLVFSVTLFSGILSVQTVLNAQVDAATNKAAKLIASSAIPIVGGAFGDAVAAIQNSVQIVKSGVGAFGILASLFLFAPTAIQAALWMGVCWAGQVASDLFDTPRLGALCGACAGVAKMILAILASVFAVVLVCAALVLFVKGNL